MARFRFRFAPVLKLRKTREESVLRALGGAQRAYQAELETKRGLLVELEQAQIRRESLAVQPIGVEAFRLEDDFIAGTRHRLVRQDQAIVRATRAVEKALRAYLTAKRQLRVLETIHDRHFQEFRKEQGRLEQRQLDDLNVMRARYADSSVFGISPVRPEEADAAGPAEFTTAGIEVAS